jgi:hypothetical protein
MIILLLLSEWEPPEVYARLLGTVAVLAVLGTLLVPILWKLAAGAGAPTGWTAGATEADAAGSARLELRYKGRTFEVQTVECEHPTRGFGVAAWEVTSAGRQPVAGLTNQGVHENPHAALAFAVQQITLAVDEVYHIGRSFDDERIPHEVRGIPSQGMGRA